MDEQQREARVQTPATASRMRLQTLTFADPALERAYRRAARRRDLIQFRISTVLGGFLFAIFGLLDGHIIPDAQDAALLIRFGVVCPFAVAMFGLSFWPGFQRWISAVNVTFMLLAGGGIIVMIMLAAPPGRHLYYAGLVLVCAYAYTFLRLRAVVATPVGLGLTLAYTVTVLWGGNTELAILVNNLFFLVGMNVIGASACYTMERSARVDFIDKQTIAERTARLDEARAAAEELARRDPLTGLFNRRYFFNVAEGEWERRRERGLPLAVALLDIDYFKSVNDRFGHAAGDLVLRLVAEHMQATVRPQDVVCRYGGEEFIVLLPHTTVAEALVVAEALRDAVATLAIVSDGQRLAVTASVGIAASGAAGGCLAALIDEADAALYQAKAAGRNQVMAAAG